MKNNTSSSFSKTAVRKLAAGTALALVFGAAASEAQAQYVGPIIGGAIGTIACQDNYRRVDFACATLGAAIGSMIDPPPAVVYVAPPAYAPPPAYIPPPAYVLPQYIPSPMMAPPPVYIPQPYYSYTPGYYERGERWEHREYREHRDYDRGYDRGYGRYHR